VLAYVFWHWPRPAGSTGEYEDKQRGFHEALLEAPPAGFERSTCHRLLGAPWVPGVESLYEDWYLVTDSAALDQLNEAAVTGRRREPHDRAAAAAAGGTAGVYRLRLGAPLAMRTATWFAKPADMSYESLWAELTPVVRETGGALWLRYMVLGPSPELCLHSGEPPALSSVFTTTTLLRDPVWPEASMGT